jgi:arsenite methyltransferase
VTGARQRLLSIVAGQPGRPHGLLGRGVAIVLNRGNRRSLAAAVQATDIAPGGVAADIGFGGGVGLGLLLDRVGDDGLVHGVEVSKDVLRRARSRFAAHVEAGRLRLMERSLTAVPVDDNSVGAAITVNTVYFVPELDAACAELARVLRPGGRVVVGIGDPEAMARCHSPRMGSRCGRSPMWSRRFRKLAWMSSSTADSMTSQSLTTCWWRGAPADVVGK